MLRSLRTFMLFLLAADTVAAGATPVVAPKPAPGEGRLVEVEVTLRQTPSKDAAAVLLEVAEAHHGIVTELDAERGRVTGMFLAMMSPEPQSVSTTEVGASRVVIGKMADLEAPGALSPEEAKLSLPDRGSPSANWYQNAA